MTLPLVKLTILVGAGIAGSVLAKEGGMPSVSDFFSGTMKIVWRQIRSDDSTPSAKKPQNNSLMAQVKGLRQELDTLSYNRPITIITSSGTGTTRYGLIVAVVMVGSGYAWWKGWKLPDMMFATRRSLSDACTSVSKQLENVYSSLLVTKRHLSTRIDRIDASLDDFAETNARTESEVVVMKTDSKRIEKNVRTFRAAVATLGEKVLTIEGIQETTNSGVRQLCTFARNVESSRSTDRIQASTSSPFGNSVELPPVMTPLRVSSGTEEERVVDIPTTPSPRVSSGIGALDEDTTIGFLNSGTSRPRSTVIGSAFLTRTFSASNALLQRASLRGQQQ